MRLPLVLLASCSWSVLETWWLRAWIGQVAVGNSASTAASGRSMHQHSGTR